MVDTAQGEDAERARIMLGLLEQVERNGAQTQRHLASELGIALGLVNAYLKRCVKKGLVKVRQAPAHRYAYYLTPQGFAEKSRLTVDYLSYSFSFFRQAKADCGAALRAANARGYQRIVLVGQSDLAEIAMICASECGVTVIGIVDANAKVSQVVGVPVASTLESFDGACDAALVTDVTAAGAIYRDCAQRLGADRVFAPALLGLRIGETRENAA